MHNRVRMITASFLTKHLLIDWRWGRLILRKSCSTSIWLVTMAAGSGRLVRVPMLLLISEFSTRRVSKANSIKIISTSGVGAGIRDGRLSRAYRGSQNGTGTLPGDLQRRPGTRKSSALVLGGDLIEQGRHLSGQFLHVIAIDLAGYGFGQFPLLKSFVPAPECWCNPSRSS
jgi:hypothetical protein